MKNFDRLDFIKSISVVGFGMGMIGSSSLAGAMNKNKQVQTPIGMIGLDTSHSTAFTKIINGSDGKSGVSDFQVVAAYPYGSRDIESSYSRIPGYTEEVKQMNVEIVDSIDELLEKVDVVLLETNDGRLHLEQSLPVLIAGKRLFIDKPIAASLQDAIAIVEASKQYNTPIFSSSSLRYLKTAQSIRHENMIGKVLGADTYSPAVLEETHPDLFWYGVHGVEILYTVMGTGCKTVTRVNTESTDIVTGKWNDGRLGTFRGIREGLHRYGGTAFGVEDNASLGSYEGYEPLLDNVLEFFRTGETPVSLDETLEIFAFMEAADESKRQGGAPVDIDYVFSKARY